MGDWWTDVTRLWAQVRGHYVLTDQDVELYFYKDQRVWDSRHSGKVAFALGPVAMFRSEEDMTPENIRHELKHCEQIQKAGGFRKFFLKYRYGQLKALILTGDIDMNPLEQEALAAE